MGVGENMGGEREGEGGWRETVERVCRPLVCGGRGEHGRGEGGRGWVERVSGEGVRVERVCRPLVCGGRGEHGSEEGVKRV